MYKININQIEKSKNNEKLRIKQGKQQLLKIIYLLFVSIIVISTMMVLIVVTNKSNNIVGSDNLSNQITNDDKTWKDYYQHNCPLNRIYKLTDYESNLQSITLKYTNKKVKNFYLNDLLINIDDTLQKNHVDIPNDFFTYLPINPAINIAINNKDALKNNFSIKVPTYKERIKKFNIKISINQFGKEYNLVICNLNFTFYVRNDVMPENFNISILKDKILIPLKTILMLDPIKGTKNEIRIQTEKMIKKIFLEKINTERSLWDTVTENDFNINYDLINSLDNYTTKKKITVTIIASNNSKLIKNKLNITFDVQGIWTKKSLVVIKSALENNKDVTNELMTVNDDTNVKKKVIDNYLITTISKHINEFGKKIWHQDFSEQDYDITSNAVSGDYQKVKLVTVTIMGKKQLEDTIELLISLKVNDTIKSLVVIKSALENNKDVTNELMTVNDDTNVKKKVIDNYLITTISKHINEFGKKIWHQNFSEQDYDITSNAVSGDYQKVKTVTVTIMGKKQLQDTIELLIDIQCCNEHTNEKIFKNRDFDVNNLNPIVILPSIFPNKGMLYEITFKNNCNLSLLSLLFKEAINDMHVFFPINNINLKINIGINLDGDNYQIACNKKVNFNVIKEINNILLVSDCTVIHDNIEHNINYLHVKAIGIIIKYNNKQEFKILKKMNVNIKNNKLIFINFSSIIKIISLR